MTDQNPCVLIVEDYGRESHAGPKAQRDVAAILRHAGWRALSVWRVSSNNGLLRNVGRALWLVMARWYRWRLPKGGTVFLQYPGVAFANNATFCLFHEVDKRRRGYKLIVLAHDLKDFRDGVRRLCPNERRLFEMADAVVLHNVEMVEAVSACGVARKKLVVLECFDYLSDCLDEMVHVRASVVNVAGNLSVARSGWMRGVGALKGLRWKMFGTEFDPSAYGEGAFDYGGALSPEALPTKLSDGFGLIWYSESPDAVEGKIVDYVRIINPHKLSLYLRAGLPVVVWEGAAVASFVRKENVGIAVKDLREIPERIAEIDEARYAVLAASARRVGKMLAQGEFTRRAVEKALRIAGEAT